MILQYSKWGFIKAFKRELLNSSEEIEIEVQKKWHKKLLINTLPTMINEYKAYGIDDGTCNENSWGWKFILSIFFVLPFFMIHLYSSLMGYEVSYSTDTEILRISYKKI